MAYWNEQFSRKKQKEMFKKRIKKTEHKTPYPMYEMYNAGVSTTWQEREVIRKKEKMFKIIGGIIILFVLISGICGIMWASGV
jgi:cytochrome b subunit of formate dehydrogenase